MYMLDTNAVILAMRHPDSECAMRISLHIGKDVCISAITFAELEFGICNSAFPEKSRRAVYKFLAGIPVIEFDIYAASQFGQILANAKKMHQERQNTDRDKMIAAHAISRNYILVTDNTKDFIDIRNLRMENWRGQNDLK